MPTVTYNSNEYSCTTAVKGADYIELLDASGAVLHKFCGVSDLTAFTIADGAWASPSGASVTRATATRVGGNLVLTTEEEAGANSLITFTVPCDCSAVTGGVVVNGDTYPIVDSVGRTVTGAGGVFCSGATVSVLLDTANARAFLLSGPANVVYSTEDLTAGTSSLPTGRQYIVYE